MRLLTICLFFVTSPLIAQPSYQSISEIKSGSVNQQIAALKALRQNPEALTEYFGDRSPEVLDECLQILKNFKEENYLGGKGKLSDLDTSKSQHAAEMVNAIQSKSDALMVNKKIRELQVETQSFDGLQKACDLLYLLCRTPSRSTEEAEWKEACQEQVRIYIDKFIQAISMLQIEQSEQLEKLSGLYRELNRIQKSEQEESAALAKEVNIISRELKELQIRKESSDERINVINAIFKQLSYWLEEETSFTLVAAVALVVLLFVIGRILKKSMK